ncbi:hypothetical protein [Caulobacter sp. BE254]|uniref:hypothetical protein n=1 Tax=Caulobacter sp. BE254 TaxID=2817720 RepID=UPI002855714C|nr:hypothetical protein [Caulobacter sp. BE254]MDR7117402.1 hypothetical protein [Caulobacter sp. BE254]
MATGQVVFVSRNGGMIVVQHGDGFTLAELLGDEGAISVGDILTANWTEVAGETIHGQTQQFDAFFEGSWGNPRIPVEMAMRIGGG